MSISISLLSPRPGSTRATPDAQLVVSLSAPGEAFTETKIEVDGVRAYQSTALVYPNAFGSVRLASGSQVVTFKMRRRFVPGAVVRVAVRATTDLTAETSGAFEFSVDEPAGSVGDAAIKRTRVDSPFPVKVLELYRQAALGATGSRAGSSLALLVHRVKPTQLACLLPRLPEAAVDCPLRTDELEPVSRLAEAATQLDFMRPVAEEELASLGVPREVVDAVSRGFASSYPQEKAGALALTVLLAADKL